MKLFNHFGKFFFPVMISLFLAIALPVYGQKRLSLNDKAVILVTSSECGYCLKYASYYDSLAMRYGNSVQMVALSESSNRKIEKTEKYFKQYGHNVSLSHWYVIPKARKIYMPMVETETFPQLIFLQHGKVVKRFVGTVNSVLDEINKELPLFVSK